MIHVLHIALSIVSIILSPGVETYGEAIQEHDMPVCGGSVNPFIACKRGHQLLYNEIVDIIEETDNHVKISIPTIFYLANNTICNDYWADKKYFLPLKIIPHTEKIPAPFSKELDIPHSNCVVLIDPYYDKKSHRFFSVGTRFVMAKKQNKRKTIPVWLFNNNAKTFYIAHIPHKKCLFQTHKNIQDRIDDFVSVLRHWAHIEHGYIPYVWGGCSYIYPAHAHTIHEKKEKQNNTTTSYYTIHAYNPPIKTGFDCSSLICRAAQISNIPYFFKNTTTLSKLLKEVGYNEPIQNGDLIWVPWHVMIVSDVQNNMLIEARGYNHGYGKIHEVPLHTVFKNIYTYNDLQEHLKAKKIIIRLDKNGNEKDIYKQYKILAMKTVFKPTNNQSA